MSRSKTVMLPCALLVVVGMLWLTPTETEAQSYVQTVNCADGTPPSPSLSDQPNVVANPYDPLAMAGTGDSAEPIDAFAEWLYRFETAPFDLRTETAPVGVVVLTAPVSQGPVAEGLQLAAARRPAMLQLMRDSPLHALEQSIRLHEWAVLPQEIQEIIEEPFSEVGDLEVLLDGPPLSGREVPGQTYRVRMRGRTFDAFVYGRRKAMASKYGIPLQGIMLDGRVALWESPVVLLQSESLAVARELFPDGSARDRSWLTGEPVGPEVHVALCGGKLYYFASEEEVQSLAHTLSTAEDLLGPNTVRHAFAAAAGEVFDGNAFDHVAVEIASMWTETPKNVLAMRLDYTPRQGTPFTQTELEERLLTSSNVIHDMSYGKTWLVSTVTPTVLILPGPKADYDAQTRDVTVDARAAAQAAGYNVDAYDIFLHSLPGPVGGVSGVGGQNLWLSGQIPPSVIVHELGHNYGLNHANFWLGTTGAGFLGFPNPDGSLVEHEEYGDVFDLMGPDQYVVPGGTPVWPNGHYSMSMKAHLNWIEETDVVSVTHSGQYRIYRFDHKDARSRPAHPLALKVHLGEHGELWVGFRRNFVRNSSLTTGAYIIWAPVGQWHRLLDTTPLSQPNQALSMDKEDAALAKGKSYTDPSGTVRITNLGWGGEAPFEYLDLDVVLLRTTPPVELFTDSDRTTRGLQGSYVNRSMRNSTLTDWRRPWPLVSGRRVDLSLHFPADGWGSRASVGLTNGTDADWEDFSVQWDGVLLVNQPVRMATRSDDSSRMWIDLDGDGSFGATSPEFINNHWGSGQEYTQGDTSVTIAPGAYRIRIQYEESWGNNRFDLLDTVVPELQFEAFTSDSTAAGLTGSYVNGSLRDYAAQDDWCESQTISGQRVDPLPGYTSKNWGDPVGGIGSDAEDWDKFSVQWDGFLYVYEPTRFTTISDDSSRMWIDLDGDGQFGVTSPEFIDNHWKQVQEWTTGPLSTVVAPGTYRLRIQYVEESGANRFVLVGASSQ